MCAFVILLLLVATSRVYECDASAQPSNAARPVLQEWLRSIVTGNQNQAAAAEHYDHYGCAAQEHRVGHACLKAQHGCLTFVRAGFIQELNLRWVNLLVASSHKFVLYSTGPVQALHVCCLALWCTNRCQGTSFAYCVCRDMSAGLWWSLCAVVA